MPYLEQLAPKEAQLGAGLILRTSGRLVFELGKRKRWEIDRKNNRTIVPVSGIGGAVELDEDFPQAAVRECVEETGVKSEIESAKRTLFVDHDNSIRPVQIDDAIKPAIIFRRIYLKGPESWQLFCPLYLARAHAPPLPLDVGGLLLLTLEQFRMLGKNARVHDLLGAGAHLIEREKLPTSCYLKPFGSTEALLAIDKSRFSLTAVLKN
jgi:hypothetical protein